MNHQQKNRNKKNETITHKPPFRWPWIGPSLNSDPLTGKTRLPHERPLVSSLFVTCPRTVTPTAAFFFVTARLSCLASYHAMPSFVVLLFLAESQSLTTTTFLWPPTRWVWKCQQQNKNYLLWTPVTTLLHCQPRESPADSETLRCNYTQFYYDSSSLFIAK